MLNTMSSEPTNFINPDLTWNKVRKGSRSSYRRPRKPGRSLNVDAQQDEKSIKREEASVSESEKLGVAVLGRRFIDKIEHVPIKKRRLLLSSQSPPPQAPSPHNEESLSSEPRTPSLQAEDSASGLCCRSDSMSNQEMGTFSGPMAVQLSQGNDNGFVNGKLSGVTNIRLGYKEDFSGIALLAAAACNNSIGDDTHKVKDDPIIDDSLTPEVTDVLVSASSLERGTTSTETGNTFLRSSEFEDEIVGLKVQDGNIVVPESSHDKIDGAGKTSAPKKDDRLHWDLNINMEAWDCPSDDLNVGSPRIGSEGIPDDDMDGENPENLEGSVIYRDSEHAVELSKSSEETKVSPQVIISKAKFLHSFSCPRSDHISSGPLLIASTDASITNILMKTREDSRNTKSMEAKSDQHDKHDNVDLEAAGPEKVGSEIDSILSKEDSTKTILPDNGTSPTEFVTIVTSEMVAVKCSAGKTGKSRSSNPSPECDTLSASGTTSGGGEPVLANDMEQKEDKEARAADATPLDSFLHVERKEMPNSYDCHGKAVIEDPVDDGYGSDVSHGGDGQMVGVEKMPESQVGYESPFEDGELRESFIFAWEQNEAEGEAECVDYDSDNRDGDGYDGGNICMSVGSDSCQNEDNGSSSEKVLQQGRPNALGDLGLASLKEFPEEDPLREGCTSSTNRSGEANNYSTQKNLALDSMDELEVKGSSAGEVGSRAMREKVVSLTEEPSCSDSQLREDKLYMQRNRYNYDSCIQTGRAFGSDKSLGRGKGGSQEEGHWVDCYYDDPQGTGDLRSRGVLSNSAAKVDGLTYGDQRRPMHYSSKGFYQPLMRRRAVAESDESYSVRGRRGGGRDGNHIRSRGRPGVYRQGFSRGPRDGFHGPTPDNPASSSVRQPHYLARRERSFSPGLCRGASFSQSRRKSRSQSRSRSPLPWHLQRERNMAPRRLSRSPDFRSDTRMERVRMPFQKSNFVAEDEFFMSPPKRRFSPLSHPRWIDNGNGSAPHFRSGVYRQGFSRGPRDEYNGPTPDNPASSSVRQPHYVARRERSFSPGLCRGASFSRSRRKSRSRSRSRSPLPWHLQRERNMAPRRLSRSPDFRSDTRMERVRMPFQKPNFVADDEFFMSPPKRRFSPLSHPRWIDNGNCNASHFRDRKSPGRLPVRNPRFLSRGSPGRTKSDDCFRSTIRPGRFTERSGGAGRGHRYDGSD